MPKINHYGNFTKKNESFTCEQCGTHVPAAVKTCRNHCPKCLFSKHVDHNPGDRANDCQGLLAPIDYDLDGKKGLVLIHRCSKCAEIVRNIALMEDSNASDDYDLILSLKKATK